MACSFGSSIHADQRLLACRHQRPLRALDAEHFQSAHGQCSSRFQDRSHGLKVIADGRHQEIDLVLHREDRGVLGEQRERRIAARAVCDGAGGARAEVAVLLGHFGPAGKRDVHESWCNGTPSVVGAAGGQARGNGTRSEPAVTGLCSAAACSRRSRRTMAPLASIVSTSSAASASGDLRNSRAASASQARACKYRSTSSVGIPSRIIRAKAKIRRAPYQTARPGRRPGAGRDPGRPRRLRRGRPGSARGRAAAPGGPGRPAAAGKPER